MHFAHTSYIRYKLAYIFLFVRHLPINNESVSAPATPYALPTKVRQSCVVVEKVAKITNNFGCLSFFTSLAGQSRLDALLNAIGVSCLVHAMSDHIYTSIYPYLCLVFASKINNLLARRFFVFLFFFFFFLLLPVY